MITVGCDPELFIKEKGKIVSFHNKINGKVKEPISFGYGQILEDGCTLEFNLPPALSCEEFDRSIETMLQDIKSEWDYSEVSCHEFSREEIDSPLCWEIGCSASFNAASLIKTPATRYYDGFRAAGGHIHLGFDNVTKELQSKVGVMCDYYLGLPSVLLDKSGQARRKVFGKAGDIRFKPYGVEYRTLSNFWIFKTELREWAYTQAVKATETAMNEEAFELLVNTVNPFDVQEAINSGEVGDVMYLLKELL